jgi:hypothetical protein
MDGCEILDVGISYPSSVPVLGTPVTITPTTEPSSALCPKTISRFTSRSQLGKPARPLGVNRSAHANHDRLAALLRIV